MKFPIFAHKQAEPTVRISKPSLHTYNVWLHNGKMISVRACDDAQARLEAKRKLGNTDPFYDSRRFTSLDKNDHRADMRGSAIRCITLAKW